MATCHLCPDVLLSDAVLLVHFRDVHPVLYGDGPQVWSDGMVVVYDMTLEPDDFKESAE